MGCFEYQLVVWYIGCKIKRCFKLHLVFSLYVHLFHFFFLSYSGQSNLHYLHTYLNLLDFLYRRECARNVIIHPTQRRATTHLKRTWTNCLLTQNICKTSLAKIATTYVCVWVWDLDGSFTFHSKIKKDTNVSLNIWSSSNIYFSLLSSMTYLNNTIWLIILLSICCLFFRFIDINIRFGWFHFYILHYDLCFISLTRT